MRSVIVALLFAVPVLAESKEDFTLRKTLESIQGNWGVKNLTVAGQATDPAAVKSMGFRFDGGVMSRTDKVEEAALMNIDVSGRIPKVELIDRYAVVRVGIIQRQGDKVMICLVEAGDAPPPTDFKSTKQNNAVLIELTPMKR